MKNYVLLAPAKRDLDEIWDYIAADSLDAAQRWLTRIYAAVGSIAQQPGIGHVREDLAGHRPILFFPVGSYLIVYRSDRKPVEIVAIVHGNRHIPRFLRSRRL